MTTVGFYKLGLRCVAILMFVSFGKSQTVTYYEIAEGAYADNIWGGDTVRFTNKVVATDYRDSKVMQHAGNMQYKLPGEDFQPEIKNHWYNFITRTTKFQLTGIIIDVLLVKGSLTSFIKVDASMETKTKSGDLLFQGTSYKEIRPINLIDSSLHSITGNLAFNAGPGHTPIPTIDLPMKTEVTLEYRLNGGLMTARRRGNMRGSIVKKAYSPNLNDTLISTFSITGEFETHNDSLANEMPLRVEATHVLDSYDTLTGDWTGSTTYDIIPLEPVPAPASSPLHLTILGILLAGFLAFYSLRRKQA